MKVSVIIPVYNEEQYIEACLISLAKQEESPDEVIIVDNNCKDHTIDIAKKYNVKILREEKQGMIFARNAGFNAARNEILARCDADVILPIDWIKKIKQDFTDSSVDAISGPLILYDLPIFHHSTALSKLYIKFVKNIQGGKEILVGPNMALRKSVWKRIKDSVCMDDSKVHEDIDLALHIAIVGGIIHFDEQLVVKASSRRIKRNPASFFLEYPLRLYSTLHAH